MLKNLVFWETTELDHFLRETSRSHEGNVSIMYNLDGHTSKHRSLRVGEQPEARDCVQLSGQFCALPCQRLRRLFVRLNSEEFVTIGPVAAPTEWLIRWGWPSPRPVRAFDYIVLEAVHYCTTICNN